jgi:membrane-bound lytic murein transglycosylase MltF
MSDKYQKLLPINSPSSLQEQFNKQNTFEYNLAKQSEELLVVKLH